MPGSFHERHRKNAARLTLHPPCVDTELRRRTRKTPQQTGAVVLELDEMWHDLKKTNKLWIWKAFCRDTGELIDWACGDRDKATLEKRIEKLEKWNVKVYYTNNSYAYEPVLPKDKVV